MVTKTYCDFCNKQIEYRDSYHLKIIPRTLGQDLNFFETCIDCIEKIKKMQSLGNPKK